jgi:NAD(P)-dependent dehydrogenase (short-subunit alcohol dehydrogenase family)
VQNTGSEAIEAAAKGDTMRLTSKVAVVTGGAHGMGESEAMIFAREGASVVVADVDEAGGRQVAAKIGANGGKARFARLDVTSEADWQEVIRSTTDAYGRLDILVNNAGISGSQNPDTLSTEAWDAIMGVNAKGVFLGMKHAIPAMRQGGGGAIVNISSISGFVGQDRLHMAYNASKGAVRIMTKSAAVQYARDGIRVNSVHPGLMPPMRTSKTSADPSWRKPFLDAVPMKREGRVEEVAHAVLFLASDEASYITGTELVVDGGFLAV